MNNVEQSTKSFEDAAGQYLALRDNFALGTEQTRRLAELQESFFPLIAQIAKACSSASPEEIAQLERFRDRIRKVQDEIPQLAAKIRCPVCWDDTPKEWTALSCSHLICQACSSQLATCPICRAQAIVLPDVEVLKAACLLLTEVAQKKSAIETYNRLEQNEEKQEARQIQTKAREFLASLARPPQQPRVIVQHNPNVVEIRGRRIEIEKTRLYLTAIRQYLRDMMREHPIEALLCSSLVALGLYYLILAKPEAFGALLSGCLVFGALYF